jgi:hypothetical protein
VAGALGGMFHMSSGRNGFENLFKNQGFGRSNQFALNKIGFSKLTLENSEATEALLVFCIDAVEHLSYSCKRLKS